MHTAQPHQEQIRNHKAQARDSADDEVLVRVENVSKIFCRDLKKSLLYGLKDSARDLMSWGKRGTVPGASCLVPGEECLNGHPDHPGSTKHQAPSTRNQARALRAGEFLAVDNVSFELRRGECLGLIGRNGAGKTTLLKMLNGLIKPDSGRIEMRGRVGALIALGAGFNPILSGRENIYVNGSVLGLTKAEIDAKIDDIIDFAEIREFIDAPVQTYSSGMQVRLGFAVATAMEPDVLILDEVLAVGDAAFRAKCFKRIGILSRNSAILFVSHDQSQMGRICDQGMVLDRGKALLLSKTDRALAFYNELNTSASKGATLLADEIVSFSFASDFRGVPVVAGNSVSLDFSVHARSEIPTGTSFINFVDSSGNTVGQVDFSNQISLIPEGETKISIKLLRIDLAQGTYTLNVAIFGDNRRETVVHTVSCGQLEVVGEPHLWCSYKIPVTEVVVSRVAPTH